MLHIEVGQLLKTNYGTGPYRVERIVRNCVSCYDPMDVFDEGELLPPHDHFDVRYVTEDHNKNKIGYLNYFDGNTLRSVRRGDRDRLLLLETHNVLQTSLAI